jgi:hypothetical protein
MAEELLDFPQILSNLIKKDRRGAMVEPVGGNLPYPDLSAGSSQAQIECAIGNWFAVYPANTNCDPANAIPPGARILFALKPS